MSRTYGRLSDGISIPLPHAQFCPQWQGKYFQNFNIDSWGGWPPNFSHNCMITYKTGPLFIFYKWSNYHRRKLPSNSGGAHGPFLPLPFPLLPSPLLRSRASQIQLGGLGERCKLPQRGLGRSPSRCRNRIWCILALKSVATILMIFLRINRSSFMQNLEACKFNYTFNLTVKQ